MVVDISGLSGSAASFNGSSVIDTALTMGDRLGDVKMIAMHSHNYGEALKNDEITFFKPSENGVEIATYKGMAVVIVDDNLTPAYGVYTTILMGPGALGYGMSAPRTGYGTELFRVPAAGNGDGQTVLNSRVNVGMASVGLRAGDSTALTFRLIFENKRRVCAPGGGSNQSFGITYAAWGAGFRC